MKKGLQKMVSITIALSMLVVGLTAWWIRKTVSDPPTLSQNEEDDSATGKNTYKIGVVAGESSSPWYIVQQKSRDVFQRHRVRSVSESPYICGCGRAGSGC